MTFFKRLIQTKNQMNVSQMTMQCIVEFKCFMTKATNMRKTMNYRMIFWCKHMTMRSFCNMLDRKKFDRCRIEIENKNIEFDEFEWIDWFEIINDICLTKNKKKDVLLYDVKIMFFCFFSEHSEKIINCHVIFWCMQLNRCFERVWRKCKK